MKTVATLEVICCDQCNKQILDCNAYDCDICKKDFCSDCHEMFSLYDFPCDYRIWTCKSCEERNGKKINSKLRSIRAKYGNILSRHIRENHAFSKFVQAEIKNFKNEKNN